MIPEFEQVINSFRATWDVSIFITGSNGKLLSGELATLLSGRYVSFRVAPFSFREYCEIHFKSVDRTVSTQTLYNYLEHIQTSLIVSKAQRYDIRGKQILTTLDKYYLTDLGLGRIHNSGFKLEMGALLENIVYNELRNQGCEVYVGKLPGREVDFVALKDGKKEYYQVAYYLYDQKAIDREFGAYTQVPDHFPKYVISMDRMDFSREGIIHRNAIEFLMD